MDVKYSVDRGWPNRVEGMLRRRIGAFTRNSIPFKIGITNWPERRASQYRSTNPEFDEMIVLYETRTRRNAEELETRLIEHNWDRYGLQNERDGGGGRHGECWYYLYIVR